MTNELRGSIARRWIAGYGLMALGACSSSKGQVDSGVPSNVDASQSGVDAPDDQAVTQGADARADGTADTAHSSDAGDGPAACVGAHCPVVLASGQDPQGGIAVSGGYVYWASWVSGAAVNDISRIPIAGGTKESIGRGDVLNGLAVLGGNIYWTESSGLKTKPVTAGGTTTTLAKASLNPGPVVLDSANAYWVDSSGKPIRKTPLAGGTTIDLVSGVDVRSLATDGVSVFWADSSDWSLKSIPVGGGTATTFAPNQNNGDALATDGTFLYWTTSPGIGNSTVWKAPVGGGSPVMLAKTSGDVRAIAVDSTDLYWAEGSGIKKVPLAGGDVTTLASGQDEPQYLALDATSIYWLNTKLKAGALLKIDK